MIRTKPTYKKFGSKSVAPTTATNTGPMAQATPCRSGVMMTPNEIRQARAVLGLSLDKMAAMLGYDGQFRKDQMHKLETGAREIRPPQERLLQAYLDGYRPSDWPE